MPILTYQTPTGEYGGVLNSRVLIGRRLPFGISLNEPGVSRLHAWIDPVADELADYVVTDAGSKAGTFVNDQLVSRHHLHDGDTIRIGKVLLVYRELEQVPHDVQPIELIAPPPVVRGDGILFECTCGAPLWVDNKLAGKRGMCRHCRQPVTVPAAVDDEASIRPPMISAEEPSPAPTVAESPAPIEEPIPQPVEEVIAQADPQPAAEPRGSVHDAQETPLPAVTIKSATSKKRDKCGVCHASIVAGEEMTTCPDCAVSFHAECWQENLGCSSYGCPQVNCLASETEPTPAVETTADPVPEEPPHSHLEIILFAASIVGSALGAPLFGGLAVIIALMSLVILITKKPNRPGLLIAAIFVCIIGIVGGLVVSDFFWFNARHIPPMLARHIHL